MTPDQKKLITVPSFTHGSLFSGIGGFDLAAEWMGWENVFHCEWNPFGQKVLKHYWPKSTSYNDITKTDFSIHRGTIDILTGGFPCQPYSLAGKQKGKEDERHLWPEMLRAIREIQPGWVVGENVFGLINWNGGMVFDEVQADLEAAGYEVWPYVLPAASVNAPHRRDRVWFIAHAVNSGYKARRGEKAEKDGISGNGREAMDAREFNRTGISSTSTNSYSNGQHNGNGEYEVNPSEGWKYALCNTCESVVDRIAPKPNGSGWTELNDATKPSKQNFISRENNALYADSTGITGEYIRQKREGEFNRPDSRYGINGWDKFPTQSPICDGNDGLSSKLDGITFPKWRNESIKAGGNAIVPQVAHMIFKTIEQYERQSS